MRGDEMSTWFVQQQMEAVPGISICVAVPGNIGGSM
jgi:hypothetical protein